MPVDQFVFRCGRCFLNLVGIIKNDAKITNSANTGVHTSRRKTGFYARETKNAFLGLASMPVVISLLIRAGSHTHSPATADILVNKYDAILTSLVQRAGGTRSDTGRVQTVIADPRQVEKRHLLQLEHGLLLFGRQVFQVGIIACVVRRTAQVIIPVWPHLDIDRLPIDK